MIQDFLDEINVIPIYNSIDYYVAERVRLEKKGFRIDNFDLLIGATAVINNFTLVTNNTKHFERINDIKIQDWTK